MADGKGGEDKKPETPATRLYLGVLELVFQGPADFGDYKKKFMSAASNAHEMLIEALP